MRRAAAAATREEDAELAAQMKASARLNGEVGWGVGRSIARGVRLFLWRGWSVVGADPRSDCLDAGFVQVPNARVGESDAATYVCMVGVATMVVCGSRLCST